MRSRVRRGGGRKSNPRGAGFRKSGPRIRKGPLRSAIKNVVKSVLNRSSETKVAAFYGNSEKVHNDVLLGCFDEGAECVA